MKTMFKVVTDYQFSEEHCVRYSLNELFYEHKFDLEDWDVNGSEQGFTIYTRDESTVFFVPMRRILYTQKYTEE